MTTMNEISAVKRDRVGKGAARATRREGLVPAVIYGDKKEPIAISLVYKEISKLIHSGGFLSSMINIDVEGDVVRCIPRDYQLEPVRDFVMHVDFLRVAKGAVVAVEVPVHFINEETSPGLKKGGTLNIVRHTVELSCPADSIPSELVIDLAAAEIGDSIHISAITLPEGVTPTITDRDFTVATIVGRGGAESDDAGEEGGEAEA